MTTNVSLLGLGNTVSTHGLSQNLPLSNLPFGESPSKRSTSVYTGDHRKVWLTNNEGWTLVIAADGTVRGSREVHPPFGILLLQTVLFAMVTPAPLNEQARNASSIHFSILGEKSGYYLCMNSTGDIYTRTGNQFHSDFKECIFEEHFVSDVRSSVFFSNLYPPENKKTKKKRKKWYIAIDKNGHLLKGRKARQRQKRTHFHLRPMIEDNHDIFESLVPSPPPIAVNTPPPPHKKIHGRRKNGRRRSGAERRRRKKNKKGPDGPFITYGSSHNRRSRRKSRRSRTRRTESRRQQSSPFASNL